MPKRIVLGNLEGAVRRGRGGKEKEWTDCVQRDILAFGIAGDWKTTALGAEVWVETVTEGGRRFLTAWRKYRTWKGRFFRIHTHWPSQRGERILCGREMDRHIICNS